jgi:hypothetical protein
MVVGMKTTLEQNYNEWLVHSGDFARNMTLRDHFAAEAMQACIAKGAPFDAIAHKAYAMADAMIKERAK